VVIRKRKLFLSLVSFTIVAALSSVVVVSEIYSIPASYASKAFVRQMSLELIRGAVTVADPFTPNRALTGPVDQEKVPVQAGGLDGGSDHLLALVKEAFPLAQVSLDRYDNRPLITSQYQFGYQTASDPKLVNIRNLLDIRDQVARQENDFQQILLVTDWVNRQWRHGSTGKFDPTHFDASTVLEQSKYGATFWCHVSAMTLVQIAGSLGFQGRLLTLSSDGYSRDHAVTEFWSNTYRKWVMFDPDFNLYYASKGEPLNVLEVHNLVSEGKGGLIRVVKGAHRPIQELESRIPELFRYFRYFKVDLRNDWLTNHYFPGHPARSDKATLYWPDRREPVILHFNTEANTVADLYWDLNNVYLQFRRDLSPGGRLSVSLQTITPNFSHYEIGDDTGKIVKSSSSRYGWTLHAGHNSLSVRPVNLFGVKGIESKVAVSIRQGGSL